MKKILAISFISIQIFVIAQIKNTKDYFTVQIREELGDLNQDGLPDKVIISMDTANITRPLRLDIYFQEKNSEFKLISSSAKILAPQYYKDGKYADNALPDVMIEDEILIILTERNNNHSEHRFKFQNGNLN